MMVKCGFVWVFVVVALGHARSLGICFVRSCRTWTVEVTVD